MVQQVGGNSLAVSYKAKHLHAIWLSSLLLGIDMREIKTYVHIKPAHEYTPHNNPELETTQMCFNGRKSKQTVVHPHPGILLSHKKQWSVDLLHILDDLKGIRLCEEKSLSQRVTCCMVLFV